VAARVVAAGAAGVAIQDLVGVGRLFAVAEGVVSVAAADLDTARPPITAAAVSATTEARAARPDPLRIPRVILMKVLSSAESRLLFFVRSGRGVEAPLGCTRHLGTPE
jgi:hypothetical protein